MTTIAWREGLLAVDSQINDHARIDHEGHKALEIVPYMVVAYAGEWWEFSAICYEMLRQHEAGKLFPHAEHQPAMTRDMEGDLVCMSKNGAISVYNHGYRLKYMPMGYWAGGSGAPYAMGAMAAGAAAPFACRIACTYDQRSGGNVQTFTSATLRESKSTDRP